MRLSRYSITQKSGSHLHSGTIRFHSPNKSNKSCAATSVTLRSTVIDTMRKFAALATLLLTYGSIRAEEPKIVAHRGASSDAPENTIPAFRLAWEQGADAIEGDFHLTQDGEIVCIHDADTRKVAASNLTVSMTPLAELKKLDVGVYRGEEFKGTTIPTIAEVLATVPEGKRIYIEVKCGVEIIPALLKETRESGLDKEQIVVISFKEAVIREIKAKAPQYRAYWLSGFKENESGKIIPSLKTVLTTLEQTGADGFSSTKSIIDEAFITSVRDKGYEYHVWTVDDLETARRFKRWGAKSITTNVPGHLKKHLFEQDAPTEAEKSRR